MKKRIPYVIFLVSLLSLTVLCGCDKSKKSAQEKQEKTENQEQVTKKRQTGKEQYDKFILPKCTGRWL